LQQLQLSAYRIQHYERLVNNYAASTVVKHCTALQNFHALLTDLKLQLEGLSEMNLADILVAGHLSRHSLDLTSSVSMMIKALRWGYKQLQIQALVVAFGSLLNSFQIFSVQRHVASARSFNSYPSLLQMRLIIEFTQGPTL